MQILRSLKNNNSGFTLLECILAIGILSIVIANIVGLQSSVVSTAQIETERMKAKWALKSAIAQVQYILDAQGQAQVPENSTFPWPTDPQFVLNVTRTELKNLKTSQFLESALSIYNLTNPSGDVSNDVKQMIAPIAAFLDTPTNSESKGNFSSVNVSVSWQQGKQQRTIKEKFFLIDKNLLKNISLPSPPSTGTKQ